MSEMLQITFDDSVFYTKADTMQGRIAVNSDSDCPCRDCGGDCDCIGPNRC